MSPLYPNSNLDYRPWEGISLILPEQMFDRRYGRLPVFGMVLEGFYTDLHSRSTGRRGPSAAVRDASVVDISHGARAGGVFCGMSVSEVELRFPGVRIFEVDPREFGPDLEILALAWTDITPEVEMIEGNKLFLGLAPGENWESALSQFFEEIPRGLGHRLWIGVGPGRLSAEVALNYGEDDGGVIREVGGRKCLTTSVDTVGLASFLSPLPLSYAPSIPNSTVAELRRLGVTVFGDLAAMPREVLENQFGPGPVIELSRLARGRDTTTVAGNYPPPRKICDRDIAGWSSSAVELALGNDIGRLAKEMDEEGLVAGNMKLWLRGGDGRWDVRSREFSPSRGRRRTLESVLLKLWADRKVSAPLSYRVELSGLSSRPLAQISFMGNEDRDRQIIEELIRDLGRRYPGRMAFWGEEMSIDRRERMLELWDPLRRRR